MALLLGVISAGGLREASACAPALTWRDKTATALKQAWKAPHGETSQKRFDVFVATTACDDTCRQTLQDAGLRIRSALETPRRDNGGKMIFTGSLQLRDLPAVAQLSYVLSVDGAGELHMKDSRPPVGK